MLEDAVGFTKTDEPGLFRLFQRHRSIADVGDLHPVVGGQGLDLFGGHRGDGIVDRRRDRPALGTERHADHRRQQLAEPGQSQTTDFRDGGGPHLQAGPCGSVQPTGEAPHRVRRRLTTQPQADVACVHTSRAVGCLARGRGRGQAHGVRTMMGHGETQPATSVATQLVQCPMGEPLNGREQHGVARRRTSGHPNGATAAKVEQTALCLSHTTVQSELHS